MIEEPRGWKDQPSIMVRLGDSWITMDTHDEVIETTATQEDGSPDWSEGSICDHRGEGGKLAYELLRTALVNLRINHDMTTGNQFPSMINQLGEVV